VSAIGGFARGVDAGTDGEDGVVRLHRQSVGDMTVPERGEVVDGVALCRTQPRHHRVDHRRTHRLAQPIQPGSRLIR
jgi:hypothetical protein